MASELRVNTITSTTGVGTVTLGSGGVSFSGTPTFNDVTLSSINGNAISGARNRIINGDMRIDQRNAGASVTNTASFTYTVDRWAYGASQASKFTVQRNAGGVTPPAGFTNYAAITSSSAYTSTSSDYFGFYQSVEGFNTSDLAFGNSSAKTVTLSFWVYSSLTGNFGAHLNNNGSTRSFYFRYNIPTANTWTLITKTITGDTSGTWTADNTVGIGLWFDLGSGSAQQTSTVDSWTATGVNTPTSCVSVVGTNGATFYLTGVQLEAGTTATPFERRFIGQELALCQRYYEIVPGTTAAWQGIWYHHRFQVQKRSTPNLSVFYGTVSGANYDGGIDPTMSFRLPAGTTTASAADWKIAATAEL
jgi:hypothetical protein